MATATLTDFLRTPKAVIAKTDEGAVRITRRDAADLVVLRADDLEHQQEGIGLASRLMRAVLTAGGDVRAAVRATFAWTALLSDAEVGEFAHDMNQHLWSATELGHYERLLLMFNEWRETAQAYAAGMPRGTGKDLTWFNEPVDVPQP
jgi:RecA/RadA recombinase